MNIQNTLYWASGQPSDRVLFLLQNVNKYRISQVSNGRHRVDQVSSNLDNSAAAYYIVEFFVRPEQA